MKGAIGNAMVMNIVITFIILTTAFLVGSISYSKAFKVKTKIVDIIEKYNGDFQTGGVNNGILTEINAFLGQAGYRTASSTNKTCNKYNESGTVIANTLSYDVCIIENNSDEDTYHGEYYKVVVFMYFDFPVIGDMIKIPVSGQTRTFFQEIDN